MTAQQRSATELSVERTYLGTVRTLLAADRTLMAWVRTSLSMISFGFTIYKVLQGFQDSGTVIAHAASPQTLGLFLTGLGTFAMVIGTFEYWWTLKALHKHEAFRLWRASLVIAVVMSLLGISLFLSISIKVL